MTAKKAYQALAKLNFWDPDLIGLTTDEIPETNAMTFTRVKRLHGPNVVVANTGKIVLARAERVGLEKELRREGFSLSES